MQNRFFTKYFHKLLLLLIIFTLFCCESQNYGILDILDAKKSESDSKKK